MTYHQLKSATHIIAVSNATKQDIIKKVGIDPKKITVIYEGYNQELFKPCRGCACTTLSKGHSTLCPYNQYNIEPGNYFLFVGTIQPRKNLERLIRAYSFFVGANPCVRPLKGQTHGSVPTLVLAGSKGWLSDEIYTLPKKLGIEEQVKFLGYVPDQDLPILLNGAIALLFPSLFEGFGLPILEAMACKTPVLTSNISSMPEITGKAALLVDPYNEEQIAQGINKLFSDQKLRNQLIEIGIAQSAKFSWEKSAKETLKVFSEIKNDKENLTNTL